METYLIRPEATKAYLPSRTTGRIPQGRNPIFGPNTLDGYQMGNWFSDLTGVDIDAVQAFENLVNNVLNGITHVVEQMINEMSKIDWQAVAQGISNLTVQFNPLYLVWQGLSTNPLTEHMARELDNLTGGTITRVTEVSTLMGRAGRGDAISRKEFIQDALFIVQVAMIVLTGGTAAGIVAASSNQMKQGTLGQTKLGSALLTVVSVAALAYFTKSAIVDATERAAVGEGQKAGAVELAKKTPLGESELGRGMIATTVSVAGAGVMGDSMTDAATVAATAAAKDSAKSGIGGSIGGPYGNAIAGAVVDKGYPLSASDVASSVAGGAAGASSGLSASQIASNVLAEIARSPSNVIDAIKRFNIDISTGAKSGEKVDIDPETAGVPRSGTGNPFLQFPEVKWPDVQLHPVNLTGWEDVACKVSFMMPELKKMCAQKRKQILVRGKKMWIYYLDDGTYYWTFDEYSIDSTMEYLCYGLAIGGILYLLFGGDKK